MGQSEVVKMLVKYRMESSLKNATRLFLSSSKGIISATRFHLDDLLDYMHMDARYDLGHENYPAMLLAAENGHADVVEVLLDSIRDCVEENLEKLQESGKEESGALAKKEDSDSAARLARLQEDALRSLLKVRYGKFRGRGTEDTGNILHRAAAKGRFHVVEVIVKWLDSPSSDYGHHVEFGIIPIYSMSCSAKRMPTGARSSWPR